MSESDVQVAAVQEACPGLSENHALMRVSSDIVPKVAAERRYRTITTKTALRALGFPSCQQSVPAVVITVLGANTALPANTSTKNVVACLSRDCTAPRCDPLGAGRYGGSLRRCQTCRRSSPRSCWAVVG